ncbi:DUF3526 domain-containing protein [uncultured Cyclobacterium sp.]|uniref:DUF3526 domain-containing protein n=1 Tax=uncultured Cyclobacterium sp. TaxID=453820 RepID=UPI0030EEDD83
MKDTFILEWKHLWRTRSKVIALLLFMALSLYAMNNGYAIYTKQSLESNEILSAQEADFKTVSAWMDKEHKGPEGKDYVDISETLWAIWYTPSWKVKQPSPMMVYSIGQSGNFGYYKKVMEWSTIYDNDLIQEIANPEQLAASYLDFGFAVLYLGPLLLIILLYNIKGFEQDHHMIGLLKVQVNSFAKWLMARISFYYLLVIATILFLMIIYGGIAGVLLTNTWAFITFFITVALYLLFWTVILSLIMAMNTGSTIKAVSMSAIWLVLAVLIPGSVHQWMALSHPSSYMTEFLDAQRNGRNELYAMYSFSQDSLQKVLLDPKLELHQTLAGKDSLIEEPLISNALPYLANRKTSKAAADIEKANEERNRLIQASYFFNPVTFFQNRLNAICETDYYAYKRFREQIQEIIDRRSEAKAKDSWNRITVDSQRLQYYKNYFNLQE